MRKLSKIVESLWADLQDRSSGDIVRDEDKFNPDYVDFGPDTTVYWAIDNLEIDGEVKFYFDDVKDYNNNGWRLPTVYEVNQLKWNIRIYWRDGCKHLKFEDGNELRLKTNGSGGFHMWTKEIITKFPSSAYGYGFNNSYDFDVTNFNNSINRLFVFLVKDKKPVNESIWADLQDRSSGDVVRKEDERTNLKELVPVDMGTTVLWADKDLEYKDENDASYFTYEEVEDIIKKSEWRLPTKDEYVELFQYTNSIKNTDEVFITEGDFDDKPQLIFNKKGYMYGNDSDTINYISHYCAWTSTQQEHEAYYMVDISILSKYIPMHYLNKVCARLVKDRK